MSTKAVATPLGQETLRVDMTAEEEAVRQAESDAGELTALRRRRWRELNEEALRRIAQEMPQWDSVERVGFLASIWNLLDGAAATPAQILARDIYLYARNAALPKLDLLVAAELQLIDPTAAQPFAALDPADPGWPV